MSELPPEEEALILGAEAQLDAGDAAGAVATLLSYFDEALNQYAAELCAPPWRRERVRCPRAR